jgi:hypothetical protein
MHGEKITKNDVKNNFQGKENQWRECSIERSVFSKRQHQ